MGRKKIGYIVRFRGVSYDKWQQFVPALKSYLEVLDGFDKDNVYHNNWTNFIRSIGRNYYIPIVFTDDMAMEVIKKLRSIDITQAEYIEYNFENEIYDNGEGPLQILYSHIELDEAEEYGADSDEKEIVTYLRGILTLEKHLLTINKCKEKLNKTIHDNKSKVENDHDPKNVYQTEVSSIPWCVAIAVIVGIGVCIVSPFILAILFDVFHVTEEQAGGGVGVLFTYGSILAVVIGVITLIGCLFARRNNIKYNQEMRQRANENRKEALKVNDKYHDMLSKIDRCKNTVEKTLHTLYDADIIESKYRKLIPVAEFYEYLTYEDATATKLSGDGGAYSLYKKNIDDRAILGNIDMLEDNLQGWMENQPSACNCIKEAKSMAANISQSEKINKFIQSAESDCRRIEADFDKYERYLASYK